MLHSLAGLKTQNSTTKYGSVKIGVWAGYYKWDRNGLIINLDLDFEVRQPNILVPAMILLRGEFVLLNFIYLFFILQKVRLCGCVGGRGGGGGGGGGPAARAL